MRDRLATPHGVGDEREGVARGQPCGALGQLPENQRAAFLMARHDNLSHEEIAEALSTSVSAVKSLIHRALEALRKEVETLAREPVSVAKEAIR